MEEDSQESKEPGIHALSLDRHSIWPLLLATALMGSMGAYAAPTTPHDAEIAVRGWLTSDSRPMGAALGRAVRGRHTFVDDRGDPLYHVIDLKPSGYVIVSGDDEVEPIIAFSPEGSYDPAPDNPLFIMLMSDLTSRTAEVRAPRPNGMPPSGFRRARAKWMRLYEDSGGSFESLSSVSDVRVPPIVSSKWSQTTECSNACYNYYCPPNDEGSASNYPCGCVATAMAQTMRFFGHPTTGVGAGSFTIYVCGSSQSRNLRGGDGAGGAYAWSDMTLDPGCSTTLAQRKAIGALCADAGVAVNMDYCSGGSGISNLTKVVNALQNTFHYSNARLAYSGGGQLPSTTRNKAINANLHAGYPVILGIVGGVGGHMIVCDGYGYQGATAYHHLNMGWAGADDAWYNLPDIDSSPSFSTVAGVVYNIYTSGSGEIIAGRVSDFGGAPVEGVVVTAGSYSDTTDARGIYALAKVPSSTQFTVTATKAGYDFTPKTVTTGSSTNNSTACGDLWDVDFATSSGVPDIVIDDAEPQCAFAGETWNVGTQSGGWPADASSYHWMLTDPPNSGTATWTPNIVTGGKYNIYTYYLQGSNRSPASPFSVVHSNGTSNYTINQQQNGSQWYQFASALELKPGTAGHVSLSNNTGDTYKVVIADAMKFVYAGPETTPPTIPTALAAAAASTSQINLSWSASSDNFGVAGYKLYRNSAHLSSAATPSYPDSGLATNTQYSYRVLAYDEAGNESAQSSQVSRYTLAKAGEDEAGSGTTGNVRCTTAVKNTWYGAGKTFTFANTAGFGTSGQWKASKFEYKWNRSPTETWSGAGTAWSSGTVSVTADAGDGYYYLHVRALNGDDAPNSTDTLDYGPFWCDVTGPSAVTVTDEGAWTCSQTTLRASWTASDDGSGSGVSRYEIAVGTAPNSQDIAGWTSVGLATSAVIDGLSLIEGQRCFVQARAIDNLDQAGSYSAADGIALAPEVNPIGAAWAKTDTVDGITLRSKVVTAALPGAFWLEEMNRTAAIKVVSSAAVARGNIVSLAGALGLSGAHRALFADVVENYGGSAALPKPLGMTQTCLGGASFNAATPGVTGGNGLYNIGLLVRCAGQVTYSNTADPQNKFFIFDDGSGLTPPSEGGAMGGAAGVLVRCGAITPPSSGWVIVTGICSSELSGGQTVPVMLVRDASDVVHL